MSVGEAGPYSYMAQHMKFKAFHQFIFRILRFRLIFLVKFLGSIAFGETMILSLLLPRSCHAMFVDYAS